MKYRYSVMSGIVLLLFLISHLGKAQDEHPLSTAELFAGVVEQLKSDSTVPPLLPTWLPYVDKQRFYVIPRHIEDDYYLLLIATEPACEGQGRCTFASIAGNRYPPDSRTRSKIHITLKNGIVARFTPSTCYTFCSEAYLDWRVGKFYYEIGLLAGKKQQLVAIANSMRAK